MKKLLLVTALVFVFGCKNKESTELEITETAQQMGDVMASIDEMGTSSGNIAFLNKSIENTFARYSPNTKSETSKQFVLKMIEPKAQAATCSANGFGGCSGNVVTRTFGGCTVGEATFNGTVTLTWGGSSVLCVMQNAGDTITRSPNFTVTGLRGATLAVTNVGTYGQKITWTSGTAPNRVHSFSSDGINRKFTLANGNILLNQTTTTVTPMTITGGARSGRVLNGGLVRVTNNLTSVTCDYMPTNVTWNASCNCPVSGTWNGSCSSGESSSVAITSCGSGTFTQGSTTTSVTFDRCGT